MGSKVGFAKVKLIGIEWIMVVGVVDNVDNETLKNLAQSVEQGDRALIVNVWSPTYKLYILQKLLQFNLCYRFPLQRLFKWEPEEHRLYHWASRMGLDSEKECSDMFPNCEFSLIDVALGGYSEYLHDYFAGLQLQ